VLKLTTLWRDGTTHLVMSTLEFIRPLAALVLRPRQQLIRFHACWRPTVSPAHTRLRRVTVSDGNHAEREQSFPEFVQPLLAVNRSSRIALRQVQAIHIGELKRTPSPDRPFAMPRVLVPRA
jgi:hypothetical protein